MLNDREIIPPEHPVTGSVREKKITASSDSNSRRIDGERSWQVDRFALGRSGNAHELQGAVRIHFQPGERHLLPAHAIAQDGIVDNRRFVDHAM